MNSLLVTLINYYIDFIGILFALAISGVVLGAAAHYFIIGPHGKKLAKLPPEIIRMTLLERFAHFFRMVSCVLLALTGIAFATFKVNNLGLSYQWALKFHIALGIIFTVSSIISIVMYFKASLFKKYDLEWFKYMGGYLTKKEMHLPAGKLNAGQKVFFWLSATLSIFIIVSGYILVFPQNYHINIAMVAALIHGLSALILFAAVLGHAYLGTAANPGTFQVLLHGKVAREWAKAHHPEWVKELEQSSASGKTAVT
ncbi:formate dehydrogenase subunit gamma [Thermanaerosceptrum fracticalcis]|uniref:Formate dehydrogenase subunit gamma n=1 Tax=Thermanaerosceptrum fracticalcis TaxID=1712410 RepID=A0A7G6DYM5_THEFR|nr:formate dehydrogenase subunit gamma [Thermanaerosceptrum fracticalcis]QNB44929.1 formate dehydrogenase subunit gamma [Thermanaerosceptrum fracticalcis]